MLTQDEGHALPRWVRQFIYARRTIDIAGERFPLCQFDDKSGGRGQCRAKSSRRHRKYTDPFRVTKGKNFHLKTSIPATHVGSKMDKQEAAELLERGSEWLAMEQEILYAMDARTLQNQWHCSGLRGTQDQVGPLQPTRPSLPDRAPWTRTLRLRRAISALKYCSLHAGGDGGERQALVDLLKRIAEQKKATPAQIALTWLLVQRPWVVRPIPGTTKLHRLEENIHAANVQLTANDLAEIEQCPVRNHGQGGPYPEQLMTTTGR